MDNDFYSNRHDTIFPDEFLGKQYTLASKGQRFLNWFIDNMVMGWGVSWISAFLIVPILTVVDPDVVYQISNEEDSDALLLFCYALSAVNYILYYTICEKAFKGHTLGKLITGTRVIREDGEELTIKDAFLRAVSRLVPFEVFSALGDKPWHDGWTKTAVIRKAG